MGSTLPDGLRILERLGDTPLGTLYRAKDSESSAEVELVFLRPGGSGFLHLWDQLSRASRIKHPNIATVHSTGQTPDGYRYVALELLRGELLSDILITRSVLPVEEATELILQVASGLQAAHHGGLLHGSLSPHSILVTRGPDDRPQVKLIRFGFTPNGAPASVEGNESADYAAPERLAGHPPDERSDIFSLGAVLHHLLAGAPPSTGLSDSDLIPEAVSPVLSKALEWFPAHRFPTVAAFARALAGVDTGPASRSRSGAPRRRLVGAVGAGIAIVVLAGLWVMRTEKRFSLGATTQRRVTVSETTAGAVARDSTPGQVTPRDSAPVADPKPRVDTTSVLASSGSRQPARTGRRSRSEPETVMSEPRQPEEPQVAKPEQNGLPPPDSATEAPPSAEPPPPPAAAAPSASVPPATQSPPSERAGPGGVADSVQGYATGEVRASEPEHRSITRSDPMRRALGDLSRLGIVAHYEEVSPGRLVLTLGEGFKSSTSLEYNLKQLYAAYQHFLQYPSDKPVLELWLKGKRIGEYTQDGLVAGPGFTPPR